MTALAEKQEEAPVAPSMPDPAGFRILIALPEKKEKSEGGVYFDPQTAQREHIASVTGLVVRMGPDAFADKARFPNGPWCKEGDWVVIRQYAGTRIKVHGQEMRIINDDCVEAVIGDPRAVTRAF